MVAGQCTCLLVDIILCYPLDIICITTACVTRCPPMKHNCCLSYNRMFLVTASSITEMRIFIYILKYPAFARDGNCVACSVWSYQIGYDARDVAEPAKICIASVGCGFCRSIPYGTGTGTKINCIAKKGQARIIDN